jgi:hypothetical protein
MSISVLSRLSTSTVLGLGIASGPGRAPARSILGSYFPTWMICFLGALVATALMHRLLAVLGLTKHLPVPVLVYLSLLVSFTLGSWLLWVD